MDQYKKAIIIDGHSFMYRFYYATLPQVEYCHQHGLVPTNAARGLVFFIHKILKAEKYDYALFAMDSGFKTIRHEQFEGYKQGRKPMPDDLKIQIPIIQRIVEALGFTTKVINGVEADDIIGTFSKLCSQNNIQTHIFTSDRDMLQLVDENISVKLFKNGGVIISNELNNFKELNDNLTPTQIIDYKAIAGDASDRIRGCEGIGHKTAINLVTKYGSVEDIYCHLDELNDRQRNSFITGQQNVMLSKKLCTINTNAFDSIILSDYAIKDINKDQMNELIKKYDWKTLIPLFN